VRRVTSEILTYTLEGTTAIVQMDDGKANALSGALPRPAFAATKTRLRGKTIAHIHATLEEDMKSLLSPAP